MTRLADLAVPTVTPHTLPPESIMSRWPAQLVLAVNEISQPPYAWDDTAGVDPDEALNLPPPTVLPTDVAYDDPNPDRYVWDVPFIGGNWTDTVCDFHALTVSSGEPDDQGLFGPPSATFTLDNREGTYARWNVDGSLAFIGPGRKVAIFALMDGHPWWLFSGRVTKWADNTDGTVSVEAFAGTAELAQDAGGDWTPGAPNQQPLQRLHGIANQWGYTGPVTGDLGLFQLANPVSQRSPWEEMQVTALSDGGIVFLDADGQIVNRDRGWRAGRSDQTDLPLLSDNVCTAPAIVWDLELSNDDEGLATSVRLSNYADPPLTVGADLPSTQPGYWYDSIFRITHPEPDLWQTTADGQNLANFLLAAQSKPTVAIRAFTLHLHDPLQDLWPIAIDRRIGDRVEFLHEWAAADGTDVLDLTMIVSSITHTITPEMWDVVMTTSRPVAYTPYERWDRTGWKWDQAGAVWRY